MEIMLRTSGYGTLMLVMVRKSLKLGCRCVVLVLFRFGNDYQMAQTLYLFERFSCGIFSCYFCCLWWCSDYPTFRGLCFFGICCVGKISGVRTFCMYVTRGTFSSRLSADNPRINTNEYFLTHDRLTPHYPLPGWESTRLSNFIQRSSSCLGILKGPTFLSQVWVFSDLYSAVLLCRPLRPIVLAQ